MTQRILVAIAALLLVSSRHIIVTSFSPTFEPHALSITIGLNAAMTQRFAAVERRSTIKRRRNDNLDHHSIGRTSSSTTTAINLIKGEAYGSEPFDENEGGVGLAKRSAVKISGVTTYSSAGDDGSSSSSNSEARELVRYSKLHELDDITAFKSMLEKMNCQLLYTGKGIELYQDPGKSYRIEEKVIQLAPIMAVKDALLASSSSTVSSSTSISMSGGDTDDDDDDDDGYDDELVINFLGGDELIIGEVMEACNLLVNELDESILRRNTKKKKKTVKFNSISYTQIPSDVCYVTVIAVGGGGRRRSGDGLDGGGVDESIAKGEIYIQDGKWWTVFEEDSIVTN
jgi:hypothetical protein